MAVDCYDYVRGYYGVPAYIGGKVRCESQTGVIVGARSDLHYVHVRFDGRKFAVNVHPDELEYLDREAAEGPQEPA